MAETDFSLVDGRGGKYLWPVSRPARDAAPRQADDCSRHRGAARLPERPSPRPYGVAAAVPLPTVAAVLGRASLTTTAIDATATGAEARELVARMWG